MKTYYVYILKCNDSSFYTGVTNNLERRIQEHRQGTSKCSYTADKLPVVLVWSETFNDINNAITIEKQIKGWSRRKKQALIDQAYDKLVEFSKNYTQSGS